MNQTIGSPKTADIQFRNFNKLLHFAATLTLIVVISPFTSASQDADPVTTPGSYRFLGDAGVTSFPFDIYRGDIRFDAEISGHQVKLLLDDGFMWDPVLFWGGPEVDELGLVTDGELSIGADDNENRIPATTASGITIRLPGIEFTDQTAVITPATSGTASMWAGSIGQVSGTFLKNLVVEINFDTMKITLIEPKEFEYRGQGKAVPWTPLGFGAWSIPGKLVLSDGRTVDLDLMMDLGYNDQAQIGTNREHLIKLPKKALPGSLGFNILQEEMLGHYARIPMIEIGGFTVKYILASFVSEEQSDELHHEVMIGLGLLSRFNLTFEFARKRLYVEPNGSFNDSFEHNMSGLSLRLQDPDSVRVLRVHPDSPAADAGIRAGDRIFKINGRDAVDYSYWDLAPLLQRRGETIEIVIVRESKELQVSIVLRRVI
ncbi:MAG: PDZ domain-containing protein [bacterium]|nr:PDZ domain-containing protein [bacterium]